MQERSFKKADLKALCKLTWSRQSDLVAAAGNLTPYVTSYIRAYSSPSSLTYGQSVWIFALGIGFQGATMFLGDFLFKKLGPKLSTLIGGWIMR